MEKLDIVADPGRNFVVIMKDGQTYKNTLGKAGKLPRELAA